MKEVYKKNQARPSEEFFHVLAEGLYFSVSVLYRNKGTGTCA